jgi:hypothetical protein
MMLSRMQRAFGTLLHAILPLSPSQIRLHFTRRNSLGKLSLLRGWDRIAKRKGNVP